MDKRIKLDNGITLIALIITIIVMLILAGVTIGALTGENGLIDKAASAKEQTIIAGEKEKLELVKTAVAIDNNGEVPLDKYIEELIKEGITTKDEVTDNEDGSKQIITDKGYSVNLKSDENGNVNITVEGKADVLPVRIVNVQLTTNTNSIKVDVEVLRGEGATYKYYYKTEDTEYKLAHEGKELSYTINNLEQNVTYTIKVEAINKNGTVYKEAAGRTGEIQSAVGILEFGDLTWNNGQAQVTITKNTEDDLKIQYQILDEELNVVKTYQEIEGGETITGLNLGETIQARLWDGTNGGNSASLTVTDTTAPNSATITLSEAEMTTEESITATVTQSDSQSGVDIASCKWVLNTSSSTTIDESLYPSTNTFNTESQDTITLSQATAGTYYLHVLTVDNAGNKTQTTSSKIKVTEILEKLEIGATVSYTPSGTYDEWTTEHSGYPTSYLASGSSVTAGKTDMTISTWKVFKIDKSTGEVQLIPSSLSTDRVVVRGPDGYNNSVKLLNDACSSLYGKTGVKARSINMDDIESVLDYKPEYYTNTDVDVDYGQRFTYTRYKTYPNIYAEEKDSVITPEPGTSKTLGLSDSASDWITGSTTAGKSISPKQTYYELSYSNFYYYLDEKYSNLLLPDGQWTDYWVASRCIDLSGVCCEFSVACVIDGNLRPQHVDRISL